MKSISTRILLFLVLLFAFFACSQQLSAQSWQWGRSGYGVEMEAWSAATDLAGNLYVAGETIVGTTTGLTYSGKPTPGGGRLSWVKYDTHGNVLWTGGSTSGGHHICNITTDPAGNLIILGVYGGALQIGSFSLTSSWFQYFIAKIDPSGTVLWVTADGDLDFLPLAIYNIGFAAKASVLNMGGVVTDAAGDIYVTGAFTEATVTVGATTLVNTDPSGNTDDIFVAKYTSAGTNVWATSVGGSKDDYSEAIAVTTTGNIYIAGGFHSSSFSVGSSALTNPYLATAAYIAEFSPSGVPLWAQSAAADSGTFATGLVSDNFGNVYLCGDFTGPSITLGGATMLPAYPGIKLRTSLFLAQFSPAHLVTWSRTISSPTQSVFGHGVGLSICGQVWVNGAYTEKAVIGPGDTLALVTGTDPVFLAGFNLAGGVAGYAGGPAGGDDQSGMAIDATGNIFISSDYSGAHDVIGPDTLQKPFGEMIYAGKYGRIDGPDTTLPNDSFLCLSLSKIAAGITLSAPPGYTDYFWDNLSTGTTRTVTAPGKYYVYGVSCGSSVIRKSYIVTPPDTTTMAKDTGACVLLGGITLNAPPGTTYFWNTGSTASSIFVTANGGYWASSLTGCTTASDTFRVKFDTVTTTTSAKNIEACAAAGPVTLNAAAGYTAILWSTGSTAPSISTTASGVYWAQASKDCIVQADTFHVTIITQPVVVLGNDTIICPGKVVHITSTQPAGYTYMWSTGSKTASIDVSDAGEYSLTVTNNGCSTTDSMAVSLLLPPDPLHLPADTILCTGETLDVTVPQGSAAVLWSTGSAQDNIIISDAGTYWATITNACGFASDTITVTMDACDIWLPSAFTPNGDSRNDIIRAMGSLAEVTDFWFSIYNRFGQRIFDTHDKYSGWDGTFNGVPQDIDVYMYKLIYSIHGRKKMLKGDLTLIR